MGAGVAKLIAKEFGYASSADKHTPLGDRNKGGSLSVGVSEHAFTNENINPLVFNLYGQFDMGTETRKLNYEWMYTALETMEFAIRSNAEAISEKYNLKNGDFTIAFPYKMGCDRAGGNWSIVENIIETIFPESSEFWKGKVRVYNIGK
jgi:hypothetical protein